MSAPPDARPWFSIRKGKSSATGSVSMGSSATSRRRPSRTPGWSGDWRSRRSARPPRRPHVTEVAAIGLSVQGDAIIPVGPGFIPLHHALLGMDYRPTTQADWFTRVFGARALFDLTGMRPHPLNSIVKALWLKETHPRVFDSAWKIVNLRGLHPGQARRRCRHRLDHGVPDDGIRPSCGANGRRSVLSRIGTGPGSFSRAAPSGEAAGRLSAAAAQRGGPRARRAPGYRGPRPDLRRPRGRR